MGWIEMGFKSVDFKIILRQKGKMRPIRRSVLIKERKTQRVWVFITGFGQPAKTWQRFVKDIMPQQNDDTIIIIRRGGDGNSDGYTSYTTFSWQKREVAAIFQWILSNFSNKGKKIHLVGHSAGAALARHLAQSFPRDIANIVQIAPLSSRHRTILWNMAFWLKGGLLGLLASIFSLLFRPLAGFLIPAKSVAGLFNNGVPLPTDYLKSLIPEGVLAFFEIALFYNGYELTIAYLKEWRGKTIIVYCPDDPLVPFAATMETAKMCFAKTPRGLPQGTPHCFFLATEELWKKIIPILQETIEKAA